jgi:predicted nucleic acid-binding Zn ribbon protein
MTEVPSRTCPHCGLEERSERERCSRCGRSVLVRAPRLRGRRRKLVVWGGAAALAAVAVVVLVLNNVVSNRNDRQRRESARATAAERVRLKRLQTPHRASATQLAPAAGASAAQQLSARAALVRAAEASITRDAQGRVRSGELKGTITGTECGPLLKAKDAVPDDRVLSKAIGRYDCVAVTHSVNGVSGQSVGRLGFPFVAALDFEKFTYVWCRNTPGQGERGVALAFVRLERACLAAKGRALGTGYVDVPGS